MIRGFTPFFQAALLFPELLKLFLKFLDEDVLHLLSGFECGDLIPHLFHFRKQMGNVGVWLIIY